MRHHGGRHRNPLLAQEPAVASEAVPRHPRNGKILHPPHLRTICQDGPARELSRGDQHQIQGPGAGAHPRDHPAAGALRADRPQYGPLHRLCGLHTHEARPRGRNDRHPVGPPDPQRGGLPRHHRRVPRLRRPPQRPDDRGHQAHPSRHGLRIHPGLGQQPHQQGQVFHRKARPRAGTGLSPVGRVLLELGHLHLEGRLNHRGLREVPARPPRPLPRADGRPGDRCRTSGRGDRLLGVPRHLDRLRHHGEGRQRLCALRGVRLERRGHLGLGLPALAQGPLRQRRACRGVLPLRHALVDRLAACGQDRRHQRPEGVHRRRYGRRADGLPPLRGAEHQKIHRRSQVPQRRQAHLIRWIRCA